MHTLQFIPFINMTALMKQWFCRAQTHVRLLVVTTVTLRLTMANLIKYASIGIANAIWSYKNPFVLHTVDLSLT